MDFYKKQKKNLILNFHVFRTFEIFFYILGSLALFSKKYGNWKIVDEVKMSSFELMDEVIDKVDFYFSSTCTRLDSY